MDGAKVLGAVAELLASGGIKVIDLTQTLSPETPTLVLPPNFGQCSGFKVEEISRYDDRGVAWYWNNFTVSEHTGTHFACDQNHHSESASESQQEVCHSF